jgi:hypothetical protein
MDLMAEIKLADDYKKGAAAAVWLKGGQVLNAHHGAAGAGRKGRGGADCGEWPEDELGDSSVRDLEEVQVRGTAQIVVEWCASLFICLPGSQGVS